MFSQLLHLRFSAPGQLTRPARNVTVLATGLAAVVILAGCSQPAPKTDPNVTPVSLTLDGCVKPWANPHGGRQQFTVTNTSDRAMEFSLESAPKHEVYADVDGIGPGTTRTISVDLNNGDYQFRCLPEDVDAILGSIVSVQNAPAGNQGSPHAVAVTFQDLVPPAQAYQKWIQPQLGQLHQEVQKLADVVASGDDAAAKDQWLTAHALYETLGAAYGAFGDADGAINGTSAGLPDGTNDQDFTGFHALESALWRPDVPLAHDKNALAAGLVDDVVGLEKSFADERVDPLDIGLRAHEIMENSIRFELGGRNDYGSGSTLRTVRSNLAGTQELLTLLQPVLEPRLSDLPSISNNLTSAEELVDSALKFPNPGSMQTAINAKISGLTEQLADVAAVADIRRTA